jgi:hypothetical protein
MSSKDEIVGLELLGLVGKNKLRSWYGFLLFVLDLMKLGLEISEIVEIGSFGLFVDFDMISIWGVKCISIEILSLPNIHDWMICYVTDLCSVMGCFWIVRLCYFCACCFECIFPYLNLWFYDAVVGVFLKLLKDWLLCCHEMFLTWKRIFYGLVEVVIFDLFQVFFPGVPCGLKFWRPCSGVEKFSMLLFC